MDDAMKAVIKRRSERLEDLLDEYEEEPSLQPLRDASHGCVTPSGPLMARVLMVGFAPGKTEDESGTPFTGASKGTLEELLASIEVSRKDVYLTNILKYRIPDGMTSSSPNYEAAVRTSARYFRREVAIIKPWVIVTFGGDALRVVEPRVRLSANHGKIIRHHDRSVVPLHHPASCSSLPHMKRELLDDFKSIPQALLELQELLG